MSGPHIEIFGNCDHAPGNTMDAGEIIIHGSGGDATAHSMRGGLIMVRDDIGYRGGIHMKEYGDHKPVLVIGGNARAFLGEYMAGGMIVVLGCRGSRILPDKGIGSGIMEGGSSYAVMCLITFSESAQKRVLQLKKRKNSLYSISGGMLRSSPLIPHPCLKTCIP